MNLLYFGFFSNEEIHAIKMMHHEPYYVAQFSYEQALCKELLNKPDMQIQFVTLYQTAYYPQDRLLWIKRKEKNSSFSMLSFLNLPFLREISYFFSALVILISWSFKTRGIREKGVYCSTHFTPISAAIVLYTKLFGIKRIVTFTDLPLFTYHEERIQKMPLYKRIIMRPYVRFTNKLQESYDGYILFSKLMDAIVNPRHKPYCELEGIYNPKGLDLSPVAKKNAIAHAGTLMQQVGIRNILDVYEQLSSHIELWLMGDGDMRQEILDYARRDERIHYLGFMSRQDVFERLKAARLLLIIRNPEDEYTKYSFPSKVFEYMVSGTPVAITKLEGIPEEYYKYMYCIDSIEPEQAAAKIDKILACPQAELDTKGIAARHFILEQKTASTQAEKVYSFLKTLLK